MTNILSNQKGKIFEHSLLLYCDESRIRDIFDTLTSIFHLSFAYVEFVDKSSIVNALKLDGTTFKGRQIKVLPKRQNVPTARSGPGRSRSSLSRVRGNYGSNFRGRRGRFRGRGR